MRSAFYALLIFRVVYLQSILVTVMSKDQEQRRYTKVISLKQGNVQGRIVQPKKNTNLGHVEVYAGIPYAAPPVGNLRFMPPGAPPQWSDTLDAVRHKPVCPQMLPDLESAPQRRMCSERNSFVKRMKPYLRNESEDCLYLNIYVPHAQRRQENKKYPVILFVHGESFEWNSGNLYDGSVVAGLGNVIFITINFRLGIFGFLKQGLMVGRANFGLSDQIAALQWTKGNIGEFGGDAGKITVMGHGTGAACVNFLMLSPVAEGLFHRAILMSGSALSEWALTATPLHYIQLKDEFNCSSDDVINCLQRKRKEDIISAFKKYELLPFENFTPVVDEIVVLNSPADQMQKYSLFSKYDLLAGVTEVESYFLLEEEFLKLGMLTSEGHKYLDKYTTAVFKKTPEKALIETIEHYLGHLRANSPMATRDTVLDALSDLLVTAPLLQTARYHASTPKNTFLYVFGHRTLSETGIKTNRSVYGDDLPYFLGIPIDGPSYHYQSEYTPQEEQLSEAMLKYFTNFAKTGNPYSSTSSEFDYNQYSVNRLSNIRWPPYNLDKQYYMYFGTPTQIGNHYRSEHDQFWNQAVLQSMKHFEDSTSVAEDGGPETSDGVASNDDHRNSIIYGPVPLDGAYSNFFNLGANGGWPPPPPHLAQPGDELSGSSGAASPPPPTTAQTSAFTATALALVALLFLLVNVAAFGFIFYQRGKLRVRENLFRNRFRCKTVSVPDLFEENENGDIYAVAESRRRRVAAGGSGGAANIGGDSNGGAIGSGGNGKTKKSKHSVKMKLKRRSNGGGGGGCGVSAGIDYDGSRRVASVKPEAISGKRMRRWPLSRQCSSSTITVDAHSKVRDWIVNEVAAVCSAATPSFSRRAVAKKKMETCAGAGAGITTDVDGIELRTIERYRNVRPSKVDGHDNDVNDADHNGMADHHSPMTPTPRKVSIAIDATPAARTGSILKQTPIEVTKSLDDGRKALLCGALPMARSRTSIFDGSNDDDDDSQHAVGTHKSSAHIRLKTPQFLLEALPISHSHSRSDPSPMQPNLAADSLYSHVDKQKKRLTSFARSGEQTVSHYEDINVTSLPDVDTDVDLEYVPQLTTEQTLCNLARRNFPKVLPDLGQLQQKRVNRLSLPTTSLAAADVCVDCHTRNVDQSGRVRPAPPPRITSTLGRRPAHVAVPVPVPVPAQVFLPTSASGTVDKQLSHISVQLRQTQPTIAEEKSADIIQTESCHPPSPPLVPLSTHSHPQCTTRVPLLSDSKSLHKKSKNMRSVTTSTTGIS